MSKLPPKLGEFSILPISIPPLPAYPVKTTHCLYLRKHSPKIPTADDARSLFLVNIPVDSTEAHFRSIFMTLVGAGRFVSITFESERRMVNYSPGRVDKKKDKSLKRKRRDDDTITTIDAGELPKVWDRDLHHSGSTAIVLMADETSVENVLKAVRRLHNNGQYPIWGAGVETKVPKLGSQRYLAHEMLQYPDREALEASVDAYMTVFNKKEEESAKAAKRLRNVPDDDGFVTVTRGGRTGPARKEEAEEAKRKELEKEEQRRKTMGNFYRFQGRERRKEEQNELIKKFEEDKKRVDGMKKGRKGRFIPE